MRVDRCDFSGFRVYPAKGRTYVRGDSKVCFDAWNWMLGTGVMGVGEDSAGRGLRWQV
jgi:ribosomal protein L24E